jgi:hypothetical protein
MLRFKGVAYPSLPNYGGVGLDPVKGDAGAPKGPCEPRVSDGDRAGNLLCARGSRISRVGGGYVVAYTTFYERGFSVPVHQFLRSLLQYYGLKLHHNPSRILHITVFVTLCETYMGIEPYFDLWNHFFRFQLP